MDLEDRSLEDGDGLFDSFRGATLRIQLDNREAEDTAQRTRKPQLELDCLSSEEDSLTAAQASNMPHTALAAVPWTANDARSLFSFREGIVEQAVQDSIEVFVLPEVDGEVLGSWILTEISIWDTEKERLVILTNNSLLVIKFDFIALKPLIMRRTSLSDIDTLVVGDLVYPTASLVPKLNGLASGVSTVVKGCLLRWSHPSDLCHTAMDVSQFEPRYNLWGLLPRVSAVFLSRSRARNMCGLRIMWNKGEPMNFTKKWNPFNSDIPFLTFTSHPLLWHKETEQRNESTTSSYAVETLSQKLVDAVEKFNNTSSKCSVQQKPILLHNYLALGSLIHNRNSLGFFKVRGRFSF